MLCALILEITMIVTASVVFFFNLTNHSFTLWEVWRNYFSKSECVENFFFFFSLVHLRPPGSLASNQRCHYPLQALLMRDTRLCSWRGKKNHVQHFLKLLMFYPIIHRPGTWEYVFVGKPWLDMVEPASLVPVSPGWHVWKLLPQSISKVQVLKYLSRQSFILAVDCLSTLPAP